MLLILGASVCVGEQAQAAERAELPQPQSELWNDGRAYSTSMIGAPGVPIPGHRSSKYWLTTGSAGEDSELRRIVSLEIDEASSQLIRAGGYWPAALKPYCGTAPTQLTATAQR